MKILTWIIVLMLYSTTALSMGNADLLTGIGYTYTTTEAGMLGVEYNFQYRYYPDRQPDPPALSYYNYASLRRFATIDKLEIENDFLFNYNPINRISLFINIPFLYKDYNYNYYDYYHYDNGEHKQVSDLGDTCVGLKIQATEPNEAFPLVNFLMGYRFKTGKSPYEINLNEEIATSRGYNSLIGGLSVSKSLDPVSPFCHLQYSYNLKEGGINSSYMGHVLKEVKPGSDLQLEVGLTGSVGQSISYVAGIDYSYTFSGKYLYNIGPIPIAETSTAMADFGLAFKISRVLVSPRIYFGLSDDAPNFMFNLKIPFGFSVAGNK